MGFFVTYCKKRNTKIQINLLISNDFLLINYVLLRVDYVHHTRLNTKTLFTFEIPQSTLGFANYVNGSFALQLPHQSLHLIICQSREHL